jgi:hypothetical protein
MTHSTLCPAPPSGSPVLVVLDTDSRHFLLTDLRQLQTDLAHLIEHVIHDRYDPLPNPVWNLLLDAQDALRLNLCRRH